MRRRFFAALPFAADAAQPELGANARINGWLPMGAESEWNRTIENDLVDPNSDKLLAAIQHQSGRFAGQAWLHPDFGSGGGIPYLVADRAPTTPIN